MNNQANTTTREERLEREDCSRCGGSGHYSYCESHGTKCFTCGGRGRCLTKRGAEANRYLRSLRTKRRCDLVVGDVWFYEGVPGLMAGEWRVVTEDTVAHFAKYNDTTPARIKMTKEQMGETMEKAIAYQETLTKAGTVKK